MSTTDLTGLSHSGFDVVGSVTALWKQGHDTVDIARMVTALGVRIREPDVLKILTMERDHRLGTTTEFKWSRER